MTVYLDHNATSPPTSQHLALLTEQLLGCSGNPSSPHAVGRKASVGLTKTRLAMAKALGVEASEIIFVSGGTEANNLGTAGVVEYKSGVSHHVVTSTLEHPAVSEPLKRLAHSSSVELSFVSSNQNGFLSLEDMVRALTSKTTLVTFMAANNEVGTIQPVKQFGDFLHYKRWGIVEKKQDIDYFEKLSESLSSEVTKDHLQKMHFHTDAVQAFGKLRGESWFSAGIDSCAISAHKLGALQGVGVLFLRRGRFYRPAILGGGQEKKRRPGTENLPGILSLGIILEDILKSEWWEKTNLMDKKRRRLFHGISQICGIEMNSSLDMGIANTIHFCVSEGKKKGEDLLLELDLRGICVSSGSACSSGANLPSTVLMAMGKSTLVAKNAIRISLSLSTTEEEVDVVLKNLQEIFI